MALKNSHLARILAFIALYNLTGLPAVAASQPSLSVEIVGAWGDDDMCLAYHRSDFHYVLTSDGRLYLRNGVDDSEKSEFSCHISRFRKSTDGDIELRGSCNNSTLEDQRIVISREKEKMALNWDSLGGQGKITSLHKCDMSDNILGIGRDPNTIDGDLGLARHLGFTVGYATSAVLSCVGLRINEGIAQHTLVLGTEAGERHALTIRAMPPEKYAQELIMKHTSYGMSAAHSDKGVIPEFCKWVYEAYGPAGWVVKGLISRTKA